MRINLVTLGCSKNTVDSEKILKQLSVNGFMVFHNSEEPSDMVIINTCGFINDAKTESINTILKYCDAKDKGNIDKVIVIGCLSERYKQSLKQEIKEVDAFFGVNEVDKLLQYLGCRVNNCYMHKRIITTPSHYAYLKISEGCDRNCTFCAIPMIRGKQISVSIENLVTEAEELQLMGVKELILIAQDLTSYGTDIYGKRMLVPLLEELCKTESIRWIRLHYAYPDNFPIDELSAIMKKERKVCRYLDIPFQHISDRVLGSMKRGYGRAEVEDLINSARQKIAGIAIRTSIITGFPGETDKEYDELYNFINEMKLDRLGVFCYSHEEGTIAGSRYSDDIPGKVKTRRMDKLLKLQQSISLNNNLKKIGETLPVLIDGEEGQFYRGRTEHDSPEVDQEVLIPKSDGILKIGEFYDTRITDALEFDLFGTVQAIEKTGQAGK